MVRGSYLYGIIKGALTCLTCYDPLICVSDTILSDFTNYPKQCFCRIDETNFKQINDDEAQINHFENCNTTFYVGFRESLGSQVDPYIKAQNDLNTWSERIETVIRHINNDKLINYTFTNSLICANEYTTSIYHISLTNQTKEFDIENEEKYIALIYQGIIEYNKTDL